jgi:hypothetical protein
MGQSDTQSLEAIERFLRTQAYIADVEYQPDEHEPQSIRALLNTGVNVEDDALAEMRVFWYTSGDFSVQYHEPDAGQDSEQYSWLRDPNSEEVRCRYQRSGDFVTKELVLDSHHPIDVISAILTTVRR